MEQLALSFGGRGGVRAGAGRPRGNSGRMSHRARSPLTRHVPRHVTVRVRRGTWNLRAQRCFQWIERSLRAVRRRDGFRVVHFSVQHDHMHLIVEADDRRRFSNGLRALLGRIAIRVNRVMGARGSRFVDRYHEVELRYPNQVHNTLRYVLANRSHHANRAAKLDWAAAQDERSSAIVVDAVSKPSSWVLRVGWVQAAAPPK